MKLFGELRDLNLDISEIYLPKKEITLANVDFSLNSTLFSNRSDSGFLATSHGAMLSESDLRDQFILFKISDEPEGPSILEVSKVNPTIKGDADEPDALAKIQLASFNIGTGEKIDKNSRATLRLDFGKDSQSESTLETVFWSVATGMNLYNDYKNKKTDAKDFESDFNGAFSGRPIEIPGALGKLSFEVVKHKEPKWWKQVFTFFQSSAGKSFISTVGFPAITSQAVGFLDELLDRLIQSSPEILFKSRPMTLAMTERAKSAYTGAGAHISVGVLNPGFHLLTRGRDYKTLIDANPEYLGTYGLLKPKEMSMVDFMGSPQSNPLNELTYAVLKVGTAKAAINRSVNFG